jgi:hypothetical protein
MDELRHKDIGGSKWTLASNGRALLLSFYWGECKHKIIGLDISL